MTAQRTITHEATVIEVTEMHLHAMTPAGRGFWIQRRDSIEVVEGDVIRLVLKKRHGYLKRWCGERIEE